MLICFEQHMIDWRQRNKPYTNTHTNYFKKQQTTGGNQNLLILMESNWLILKLANMRAYVMIVYSFEFFFSSGFILYTRSSQLLRRIMCNEIHKTERENERSTIEMCKTPSKWHLLYVVYDSFVCVLWICIHNFCSLSGVCSIHAMH